MEPTPKRSTGQWVKDAFVSLIQSQEKEREKDRELQEKDRERQTKERLAAERKDKAIMIALILLVVASLAIMAGREFSFSSGGSTASLGGYATEAGK